MMGFVAKLGVVKSFIGSGETSNKNKSKTEHANVKCISKISLFSYSSSDRIIQVNE